MKKNFWLICVGLCSVTLFGCEDEKCYVPRAAFDIGSASTKARFAIVDVCNKKIVKVIKDTQSVVRYKDDLARSRKSKTFSDKIQAQGIASLKKMKEEFLDLTKTFPEDLKKRYPVIEMVGTATAAFRSASNGRPYAARIEKETGIKVTVISQDDEAKLGFLSGAAHMTVPWSSLVVWDIGGGSMQITALKDPPNQIDPKTVDSQKLSYVIYKGELASETLKHYLIEEIQKKSLEEVDSPNPMTMKDMEQGMEAVKREAGTVPEELQKKLSDKNSHIVGVGGVHYQSIRTQLGEPRDYSLSDLLNFMKKQVGKTDADIGGEYASTQISNFILVAGFMQQLDMNEVEPVDGNLYNGAFVNTRYWTLPHESSKP